MSKVHLNEFVGWRDYQGEADCIFLDMLPKDGKYDLRATLDEEGESYLVTSFPVNLILVAGETEA